MQDFSYLLHPFSNFPVYPCILNFHPASLKNSNTMGSHLKPIFRRPSLIKMGLFHTRDGEEIKRMLCTSGKIISANKGEGNIQKRTTVEREERNKK